eukprot:CAMPEP_0174237908 /NCGR_PEP_ID=MMETSP0417-20130205/9701_1 /TAXON_ID=242541 /ORGANISM="Mayorella sp, Strain BSH-02190019" /LENGTH=187 /DNA_ID=CAMNT_0015316705 /DNA_START=44 /DNA_END=603 /DNA_ORIENTATION=+
MGKRNAKKLSEKRDPFALAKRTGAAMSASVIAMQGLRTNTNETLGQMKQRHRAEYKTLRDKINTMKEERTRHSKRDASGKEEKKQITQEIKRLQGLLERRHQSELRALDPTAVKQPDQLPGEDSIPEAPKPGEAGMDTGVDGTVEAAARSGKKAKRTPMVSVTVPVFTSGVSAASRGASAMDVSAAS